MMYIRDELLEGEDQLGVASFHLQLVLYLVVARRGGRLVPFRRRQLQQLEQDKVSRLLSVPPVG